MSCRVCQPCSPTDQTCITVSPVLAPCSCPETPATREEGPPGSEGPVGDTVTFTVGTVTEGSAGVTFVVNTPTDYTVDFVIPQPPIHTANTWTEVQEFTQGAVFDDGITITAGTTSIDGDALEVVPNANFALNVGVGGNQNVTGTQVVTGNTNIVGNMSVAGGSFLQNTQIDGEITFDPAASILVDDAASGRFPRGILVLNSCNAPQLLPNRGGDLYQKEDATGLLTVVTLTSGSICDSFVINVPVSSCLPQVTPVVDVQIRIGYNFGAQPNGAFIVRLWKGAITTGVKLDEFTQGDNTFDNTLGGCILLDAQLTLPVGNTSFFVEVVNNTDQDFIPTQVTFWGTNS